MSILAGLWVSEQTLPFSSTRGYVSKLLPFSSQLVEVFGISFRFFASGQIICDGERGNKGDASDRPKRRRFLIMLAAPQKEDRVADDPIDVAIAFLRNGQFGHALPVLQREIQKTPANWNLLYMAGQCCRFLDNINQAVLYLTDAAALKQDEPAVWLALGISQQLDRRYAAAVESLLRSIEADSDYELAYNSLALTQKRMGLLDKARANFDAGLKALSRKVVKCMRNDPANPIDKHFRSTHNLWTEYAVYGGLYLCSQEDGIDEISWPTGAQALEEERTKRYGGLYWTDQRDAERKRCRLFLPNFFNAFAVSLKKSGSYAQLAGNMGTVIESMGEAKEAAKLLAEASEFLPNT